MRTNWILFGVPALLLAQDPLPAQVITSAPPSAHDCRVAANKLGSAPQSASHQWALDFGRLDACGEVGAQALARELGRAGQYSDTLLLGSLYLRTSMNRHPAILRSALDVAADRSQPVIARAVALNVLLRQHNVEWAIGTSLTRLASVPVGRLCSPNYVSHVDYSSMEPLPPDYREQIEEVTLRVASDPAESTLMRDLAACVGRVVREFPAWGEEEPEEVEDPGAGVEL